MPFTNSHFLPDLFPEETATCHSFIGLLIKTLREYHDSDWSLPWRELPEVFTTCRSLIGLLINRYVADYYSDCFFGAWLVIIM